jgi:hypothetical protein
MVAYAAGLVVYTEILLWLGQVPSSALVDGRVLAIWLRNLGLTALAGALLALVALAATGFQMPGALAGPLVGCAAAAVLLAVPWLLVRKRGGGKQESGR